MGIMLLDLVKKLFLIQKNSNKDTFIIKLKRMIMTH
jgi:hypothetical protein